MSRRMKCRLSFEDIRELVASSHVSRPHGPPLSKSTHLHSMTFPFLPTFPPCHLPLVRQLLDLYKLGGTHGLLHLLRLTQSAMPSSKRTQPSTQPGRRVRQRPKTTSTTVVSSSSDLSVVDLTSDQEVMDTRNSQFDIGEGCKRWRGDSDALKKVWKAGEIEGYGGLIASIRGTSNIQRWTLMADFTQCGEGNSAHYTLDYEDIDGREFSFGLTMAFESTFNA